MWSRRVITTVCLLLILGELIQNSSRSSDLRVSNSMVSFGRGRQCCVQEASEIIWKTLFVHIKLVPAQQDMKLEIAANYQHFVRNLLLSLLKVWHMIKYNLSFNKCFQSDDKVNTVSSEMMVLQQKSKLCHYV